jgi:hypothetical protein
MPQPNTFSSQYPHDTTMLEALAETWKSRKGTSFKAPLPPGSRRRLKVKLKGKLNLPRIIRVGSSGPNFAEGGTGIVARSTDGHNAVATEI